MTSVQTRYMPLKCEGKQFELSGACAVIRNYYGWYFFRGPPAFDGLVFIRGRGRCQTTLPAVFLFFFNMLTYKEEKR
jgi:hypothetical protein